MKGYFFLIRDYCRYGRQKWKRGYNLRLANLQQVAQDSPRRQVLQVREQQQRVFQGRGGHFLDRFSVPFDNDIVVEERATFWIRTVGAGVQQ